MVDDCNFEGETVWGGGNMLNARPRVRQQEGGRNSIDTGRGEYGREGVLVGEARREREQGVPVDHLARGNTLRVSQRSVHQLSDAAA